MVYALVVLGLIALVVWNWPRRPVRPPIVPAPPELDRLKEHADTGPPDLDRQLAVLARAGLTLAEGASRETLTDSFPESEYRKSPFDLLLFSMASDIESPPWGRPTCDRGMMLDMECILEDGDYARIVRAVARVAGLTDRLEEVSDEVDLAAGRARLSYRIGGIERSLEPRVQDDWADPDVVATILDDIEAQMPRGRHFRYLDNGQAVGIFALDEAGAAEIERAWPGVLVRDRQL